MTNITSRHLAIFGCFPAGPHSPSPAADAAIERRDGAVSGRRLRRSGFIDWPKASGLVVVTTIIAPFGSLLAQYTNPPLMFGIYLAAVIFLAYTLFRPVKRAPNKAENYRLALLLAALDHAHLTDDGQRSYIL